MQSPSEATDPLVARLRKLGLACDEVPLDRLTSASAALACFPMYLVANLHAWTGDRQWHLPVLDLPGAESIREAFAIGSEEGRLQMTREHRRALGAMLTSPKPADLIIYEYALETLKQFLAAAAREVADQARAAVARTVVAAARASGEGFLGSGERVSPEERECIARISAELGLDASPAAQEALRQLDPA